MKKIAGLILLALISLSLVLTAGCTGTDETPAGTEKTAKSLNFGYQPSTHQIAYMAAMEKGWWSENLAPFGYTTDRNKNEFQFPTGAPEMQSMIAGDIDVAYVGAAPVISALATGLDGKIVAAVQTQGSALVVGNDIAYEKPEDLKGHTIATFPSGTIQDTLLRGWLRDNGIDDEKDVDIRPMGPGDAITAITAGQIDAVFLPAPSPTIIENDGAGRIVVNSGEMMKDHPCCVLVVSGKMIRENPDAVVEIVKTHIKATDYIRANKDEAAEIYSGYTKNTVETVKDSFSNWDGEWVSDPNIITGGVMDYVKTQAELGYIEKELTQDEIFDLSFYEKATA
ncbi:ABC transporter substrate-binding protein [Methanoplanus limicola]|uniref:Aliphatic sulfonates family ABC transporter, periplasmic ligand-binding protein n=1 Tax=Methanoplanus limicola DSM 2279 TaxID=937775 RepID=H1Z4H6_9EURY|nr:ABC transporter substrate-binding protein [Methanoplanus limicola]EHQ36724.1 aliphatic sulfonates family ABC transporter, periplasmic ligand-binding protein [Methanoplanus limicola DSM 2279]